MADKKEHIWEVRTFSGFGKKFPIVKAERCIIHTTGALIFTNHTDVDPPVLVAAYSSWDWTSVVAVEDEE